MATQSERDAALMRIASQTGETLDQVRERLLDERLAQLGEVGGG